MQEIMLEAMLEKIHAKQKVILEAILDQEVLQIQEVVNI